MTTFTRGAAFAAVAITAASAFAAESLPVRRVAFIVGANDGGRERVQLRYAESDANNVAGVLERLGGVAPGDLKLLLGPDRAQFLSALDDLRDTLVSTQSISRRTELIVYYSGHSDEEGLLLKEERYPYTDFRRALDTLPADVRIAILDSCASGAMTRRKGGVWKPPFMVDASSTVQGHAILTSTGDDEAAQESDRLRSSFFTHYLLTGLRGGADVTRDGKVTLSEAYQFAYNETLARTESTQAGAQHPAYDMQLSGTGDLVLTDLRQSSAALTLDAPIQGKVFVRDTNGRLAAEVRKASGAPLELGLEAGDYGITLLAGEEALGARVSLKDGARTSVGLDRFRALPKEYAVARGGKLVDPIELPKQDPPEKPADPAPTPPSDKVKVDIGIGSLEIDLNKLKPPTPTAMQPSTVNTPPGYVTYALRLALIPGLDTGIGEGDLKQIEHVGLNLAGKVDQVEGVDLSLVSSWVTESVTGAQVAGVFSVAESVTGGQGSGVFNVSTGETHGLQLAGVFNVAGGPSLGEGPAGGVIPKEPMWLLQGASVFNVAGGPVNGLQLAGVFNVANGDVNGAQGASVFNVAGDLNGAQIALVNVGGDVNGAQIGLVNVAGLVTGTQIGLVNVNEDVDGVPIGLVNWSSKGRFALDVYGSELNPWNLALKFGTSSLFTEFVVGGSRVSELVSWRSGSARWSPGFGVGWHKELGSAWLDVDVLGRVRATRSGRDGVLDVLVTPRLQLGWNFLSRFSIFAGAGVNFMVANTGLASPAFGPNLVLNSGGPTFELWPALFAGLQL